MLFSKKILEIQDHVVIQVHAPRTGGTTLRTQLNKLFGIDVCLMNYRAEIEYLSDSDLIHYQQVSGHFSYGMHQYFSKKALYVTTVRDPVARFISLYSVIRARADHRLHIISKNLDINEFLIYCLKGNDPELTRQVKNLQCQFVCGEESFSLARKYIDEKYFLACIPEQIDSMIQLLGSTFNLPPPAMEISGVKTQSTPNRIDANNHLTSESLAILIECNSQDLQLFHYVRRAFEALQQGSSTAQQIDRDDNIVPNSASISAGTGVTLRVQQLMNNASNRFLECLPFSLTKNMQCLWIGEQKPSQLKNNIDFKTISDVDEFLKKSNHFDFFDLIVVAFPMGKFHNEKDVFSRLISYLSPDGIIQICCLSDEEFYHWHDEYDGFSYRNSVGSDFYDNFKKEGTDLRKLKLREKFPLYGSRCTSYVFFKSNEYFEMVSMCLASLRKTLSVTIC